MTHYEYVNVLGVECEIKIDFDWQLEDQHTGTPEKITLESAAIELYKCDKDKLEVALLAHMKEDNIETRAENEINDRLCD